MRKTRLMAGVIGVLALLAGALLTTGCNTWEGAGKDVEKTGEAMQGD